MEIKVEGSAKETVNKWMMYRAKLYSFWYYPNQEFYFVDGCGVLRGHNGSGKSVTTQSLVTVLLDGDARPHKLDPFGGRDRTIKETVLGEEELLGLKERIGYLTLEFKKENGEVYKTLGMGVQAHREKQQPKIWYFIVDGKRIGEKEGQLRLYKEEKIQGELKQIPLNEEEFRSMIAKHRCGRVFNRRDEYAENVNKQLFGFDTLESYKGLIDLLIQARSPKLSDNSRPDGVAEVLSESLPQLTNAELNPLTSSIESIDRLEKQLANIKKDKKAIEKVHEAFEKYNKAILTEKSNEYLKALKEYNRITREMTEVERSVKKKKKRLIEIEAEINEWKNKLEANRVKLGTLGVEDIEELESKKQEMEKSLAEWQQKLKKEEDNKYRANIRFRDVKAKKDQVEIDVNEKVADLDNFMSELKMMSETIQFEHHERYYTHFQGYKEEEGYSFFSWLQEVEKYERFLAKIKEKLQKKEVLENRLSDAVNALGELQLQIDQAQVRVFAKKEQLEQEENHMIEQIQIWNTNSKELNVSSDVVETLLGQVGDVYDTISYSAYHAPINSWYNDRKNQEEMNRLEIEHRVKQFEKDLSTIQNELKEWKNKKEIDPPFVKDKRGQWNELKEKGINYVTFYEAFEFLPHVEEQEKIWIQQALLESGILSAVLVDEKQREQAKEITTVLECMGPTSMNLSHVLTSKQHHLQAYLEGIWFEKHEEGYILENGQFKNGCVEGQSSLTERVVYIGKEAREQHRLNKIAELEDDYMKVLQEKEVEKSNIQESKKRLALLKDEYNAFPSFASLETIHQEKKQEEVLIQNVYEVQRQQLDQKADDLREEMKNITMDIKRHMDFTELELTVDEFQEEEHKMKEYRQCLRDIQNSYSERNHARTRITDLNSQYEDIEQRVEEIDEAVATCKIGIDKTQKVIAVYEEQLNELGSDDIRKMVNELTKSINHDIPQAISELDKEQVRVQMAMENEEKYRAKTMNDDVPYRQEMKDVWESAFREHYKLGFVVEEAENKTWKDIATAIVEKYGDVLDKKRKGILELKNELSHVYQSQSMDLFNYDMKLRTVSSEFSPTFETENEEKQNAMNIAVERMSREKLTLQYNGVDSYPSEVLSKVEARIEELEANASEKDRELYERILVNTLGDNIRRKIHYVQAWEKEMNKFMEHENLIKFRIKWVPKKKENEGELDTNKLVEMLKKDSQWVDINSIAKHFRSKIKEAKKLHSSQQEGVNLQQIMRDVLDYRKWFNFEIYFTKKGDKEMRLTKSNFGKLSGGQRVLALITPILAAVYAKYSEAKADCPKLITLDEAFARVDEINIEAMFAYIRKMRFNYILNSQSLWGCFASVPSLNIYELARPDNIPAVAIESYYWNGAEKARTNELDWESDEDGRSEGTTGTPIEIG